MIRFELWPENEIVILEAIKCIQKETGIQISPNRLINMLIPAIESIEFQSETIITLKQSVIQPSNTLVLKPPNPRIRRTSKWMSGM